MIAFSGHILLESLGHSCDPGYLSDTTDDDDDVIEGGGDHLEELVATLDSVVFSAAGPPLTRSTRDEVIRQSKSQHWTFLIMKLPKIQCLCGYLYQKLFDGPSLAVLEQNNQVIQPEHAEPFQKGRPLIYVKWPPSHMLIHGLLVHR